MRLFHDETAGSPTLKEVNAGGVEPALGTSRLGPGQVHRAMIILRIVTVALALFGAPVVAFAQPRACPQFFPSGQPPTLLNPKLAPRTTLLCNGAYAALASGVTHGAIWSAERLSAATVLAARGTQRQGQFHPDDRVPFEDQAQLADYRRSGYDRGHMTPSGDMPDEGTQQQSFTLTNIVPQTPQLNRGVWEGIETAVRNLAEREGEIFVVTGPAFQGQEISSIGPSGVLVPTATWKAVYDPHAQGAGVYICGNTARPQCNVLSVLALARITGIEAFPALPERIKTFAMQLPSPEGRSRRRRNIPPEREPVSLLRQLLGK